LLTRHRSGVGKTSLVHSYVHHTFTPSTTHSTIGASFLTKRVLDTPSDTTVRLQIWDTAGQERFRSISRLYYRGAHACVLCYDITDESSFDEMTGWLRELRRNVETADIVVHVVGTKADLVAEEPAKRRVPFERCIAYVAEHLYPSQASTPPATAGLGAAVGGLQSPDSKRSSGFWGQDIGWDCCHEISAKDGEGIEEVFRVITRKLVEERNRKMEKAAAVAATPGWEGGSGHFDGQGMDGNGSFRVGHGDKRRSWLGFPPGLGIGEDGEREPEGVVKRNRGRCC
jgi:small GTP-binding protein